VGPETPPRRVCSRKIISGPSVQARPRASAPRRPSPARSSHLYSPTSTRLAPHRHRNRSSRHSSRRSPTSPGRGRT